MPEKLWMEIHNIVQETVTKTIPQKQKCKKAKWLYEEALQIAEKRDKKGKGEGERYTHHWNETSLGNITSLIIPSFLKWRIKLMSYFIFTNS